MENPEGEVQLFVSEENSLTMLPKDIVGLIRIPAATHTTGVTRIHGYCQCCRWVADTFPKILLLHGRIYTVYTDIFCTLSSI